ncbi:hypothetical protein BJ878DRAFT_397806, partial [Calycina marina]
SIPNNDAVARLETISLASLRAGEKAVSQAEADKLFAACRETGCFYLDFREEADDLSSILDELYELLREIHELPGDEKLRFDVDKLQFSKTKLNGYKPVGRNFGGLKSNRDGFATYTIPKDGVLGLLDDKSFLRPEVVNKHMNALIVFTTMINDATQSLLASLSTSLGLPQDKTLQGYHRSNVSSPDIIRMLQYENQPASERGDTHTPHTDIGSLTFLFTQQPGLQIFNTDSQSWTWISPRDNLCPIVNLGDSIAMLTNRFFCSCLHKVSPSPTGGEIRKESIAYLVRPEVG